MPLVTVHVDTDAWRRVVHELPIELHHRWDSATDRTAALARTLAPYRTGYAGPHPEPHIRNSIFSRSLSGTGFEFYSVMWTPVPHAKYIEFGRGPVFPIRAKALRWWSGSRTPIFARHAGPARAQPFMRPAAREFPRFLVGGAFGASRMAG